MEKIKIGIMRETKNPEDNRVALSPENIWNLQNEFDNLEFKVQSSSLRAYTDKEYRDKGIEVVESLADCNFLLGIKEADISTLLPNRHYMFFGHIAKMQPYNKPLFKALIEGKNTFSDYEYLVDNNGHRLVAFGWYAGVVGVYYTLRGYGLRNGLYEIPMPGKDWTVDKIISVLNQLDLKGIKIIVTGEGRVASGAEYVLGKINSVKMDKSQFLSAKSEGLSQLVFSVAGLSDLVAPNDNEKSFDRNDFHKNPERYHSVFNDYFEASDILISGHYWGQNDPVYLNEESYLTPGFRIKMIGDITCDIRGSIMSTLRSSTHDAPYYDYNPKTRKEEEAFSSVNNITVMAVDTCPNALPRETSEFFGEKLIQNVIRDIAERQLSADNLLESDVLKKATILDKGILTDRFGYLQDYVDKF